MSEDDYDQRKGTVREWIREQKAKDPNWKPPKPKMSVGLGGPQVNAPPPEPEGPPPGPESVEGMSVGARCEVMPGKRRGSVGYLGEVEARARLLGRREARRARRPQRRCARRQA